MSMSERESVLLLLTLAAVLFGGSAMLAKPKIEEWQSLKKQQTESQRQMAIDQRLIESRGHWEEEFAGLSKLLPRYPADRNMDIYWLSIMDNTAAKHNVKILRRQAGDEKQEGEVYELPVECRDWEAELEPFVRFLFDLRTQAGMLDIRQLYIKPTKDNKLRGRFTLYCAYTREAPASEE